MTLLEAIILGIVQGLTEFLPISSSGHLVLMEEVLAVELPGLTFEIGVHVGTLAAVLVVYRQRLVDIMAGLVHGLAGARAEGDLGSVWDHADARLGLLLVLAMVPTAVLGMALRPLVTALFSSVPAVAVFWLLTGSVLWLLPRLVEGVTRLETVNWAQALWIGLVQGLAVLPGVSRSGLTLFAGMAAGLKRRDAADFSFLLSVPAIAGAAAVDLPAYLGSAPPELPPQAMVTGMAAAALAGYAAIRWFLHLVSAGRLHLFAYYCWALAGTVMAGWYFGRVA